MIDVCLLGTGGMMPLPRRRLTAMMARYNGKSILIDCGEGTQVAIKEKGWTFKPIDVICFTHFHGDHIGGLPGLLLTMGNAERKDPLLLVGPKGLEKVVKSLLVIAQDLPFEIKYLELSEESELIDMGDYRLEAFRVNHRVTCYGYNIVIDRTGKFDAERAKAQGIPVKFWNRLQKGETVEENGNVYSPDMVLGPQRKGIKVTYCTDTRPTKLIAESAAGADLFICEGMYGEKDKEEKAKEKKHMTFYEAAKIAKEANPEQMWLTHYSPSLVNPNDFMDDVKKIFPRAKAGKDLKSITISFKD
ncbi:MAG: ribonuclease Z [Parasporobacterium sp.]|nr:ribonuclease Z [Parasporobacterium sp.]